MKFEVTLKDYAIFDGSEYSGEKFINWCYKHNMVATCLGSRIWVSSRSEYIKCDEGYGITSQGNIVNIELWEGEVVVI